MTFRNILACSVAAMLGATAANADGHLTEVSFGTNWVAQAEHGGFYQSVAGALIFTWAAICCRPSRLQKRTFL